jgi:glycosyltransferase involved in cell wall biosynthesis
MGRTFNVLQLNSARKYIGEAAHTLNLTEALRRRGHAVTLGLRDGFDTCRRAAQRGLDPIPFHMPHRWWPPQDLPDIRRIARLVAERRIELIHAHRGKDHWQAVLATRLFRLKVPVIRTRHVVTPLKGHGANRWLARRTAALVAVSHAVADDVRRAGVYDAATVALIPGGVDLDLFAPVWRNLPDCAAANAAARAQLGAACSSDGPLAICVARFAIVKAHRVLIAAWQRVVREIPAARLALIGDGQLMAACQAQVQELGLQAHVLFLGRREDIPALLDAADIGVLSSVGSEGFSRAVLEYMAKGLPVVATRVGAVPDLIDDGVHGALVQPNDETALADALVRVLSASVAQRLAWGRAAREKAERGFGYNAWAEAHEKLYASVLDI